jgi:hypothetical protein
LVFGGVDEPAEGREADVAGADEEDAHKIWKGAGG